MASRFAWTLGFSVTSALVATTLLQGACSPFGADEEALPSETDSGTASSPDAAATDGPGGDASTPVCPADKDFSSDPLNCGKCGLQCESQTCTKGVCGPTLFASVSTPLGIAVNSTAVYVVTEDNKIVWRAKSSPLNALMDNFAGGESGAAYVMATDTSVCWTAKSLVRCTGLEGDTLKTLVTFSNTSLLGIATGNAFVYAADQTNHQIHFATTDGDLIGHTNVTFDNYPEGLTYDTNGDLYVAENASTSVTRYATPTQKTTTFAKGYDGPAGLASDDTYVYVAEQYAGNVWRKRKDSSVPADKGDLLASGQSYPSGIAVDASHVYWTNRTSGQIWRLSK